MTVANMKRLAATHHRWQRKSIGITWKDEMRNEEVSRRNLRTSLERSDYHDCDMCVVWNKQDPETNVSMGSMQKEREIEDDHVRKSWKATVSKHLEDIGL